LWFCSMHAILRLFKPPPWVFFPLRPVTNSTVYSVYRLPSRPRGIQLKIAAHGLARRKSTLTCGSGHHLRYLRQHAISKESTRGEEEMSGQCSTLCVFTVAGHGSPETAGVFVSIEHSGDACVRH
jgi:hypothetical protein